MSSEFLDIISVITDSLASLGAIIAIFISIRANNLAKKANDATNNELKQTLKLHNQSINIDLFDKRLFIIDEIATKNKTSDMHLELLFNNVILNEYLTMKEYNNYVSYAYHDLNEYSDLIEGVDGDGDYTSALQELIDAREQLIRFDYSEDEEKHFKMLCKKYEIFYSETGEDCDYKTYNYNELTNNIDSCELRFKAQKEKLLTMMKAYVKSSISQ